MKLSLLLLQGWWAIRGDAFSLGQKNTPIRPYQQQLKATSNAKAPSVDDPSLIRNVAIVGHSHAGKTTLAEWMLFDEHVITQKPDTRKSTLDSDPMEESRHSSLFSHFMRIPHPPYLLEIADTPYGDFPSDAFAALDGADSAVLVVSAADGVQSGTISAFQHCSEAGIQCIAALSKMDRPFLNTEEVILDLAAQLKVQPVPIQIYQGEGEDFVGVKSILTLDSDGKVMRNIDPDLESIWVDLEEAVAMTDDELLSDYLEHGSLSDNTVIQGLRQAVADHKLLPLVFTSATKDKGILELMDAIASILPNPIETREGSLPEPHDLEAGVEAGFAARVIHTTIDSFGSLSVVRVVSNARDPDTGLFASLPPEFVNLRTGTKTKMPSASTCFGLCGKQRQLLDDNAQVLPGDIIALPKLPDCIGTNDVICDPSAVIIEEAEIKSELTKNSLSPLSRPIPEVPLMASATVSLTSINVQKKGKKNSGSGGDDKLLNALMALSREDLSIKVEQTSGQWIVKCMSNDHLHLLVDRLKDRYGVEVMLGDTPVAYRETIAKAVKNIEGKHKKQSGGSGQFGVCYITAEPLEEGSGVEFISNIKGGVISKTFINSVEKGVREQLSEGGPLGFPVTDIRITLTDGKMHSVDSKDIAFQSAGRQAVKRALETASTCLLQPMEKVTFRIPETLQGDINGMVSRVDGYVTASQSAENHLTEIEAILPAASITEVSETLRAETAGEGHYVSAFSHYQLVSEPQVKTILDKLHP